MEHSQRIIEFTTGIYIGEWWMASDVTITTNYPGEMTFGVIRAMMRKHELAESIDPANIRELYPDPVTGLRNFQVTLIFPGMVFYGKN
jgi:hypothetical protein